MGKYKELYSVEKMPVTQNRIFNSQNEAINCVTGDVLVVQDMETGLIFNKSYQGDLIQYDSDYQNEQAVSECFKRHLDAVTTIISQNISRDSLLEIGCGKGFFLEHLLGLGMDVAGIDPAYEGENPAIIKSKFQSSLGISAKGIILRHVLEHIADPVGFLFNIKRANGGTGKIYIEVPCFEWIIKNHAWFDIYYEHVNYFRLADFYGMFDTVYESGHLFGGQYLYVVADLESLKYPKFKDDNVFRVSPDFAAGVQLYAEMINKSVEKNGGSKRTVIWGGSSKGVIFALFMQRFHAKIDFIIDINPEKQGRYVAVSGLIVRSPEEGLQLLESGDNIIIMNPNYFDEIVVQSGDLYNYLTVN